MKNIEVKLIAENLKKYRKTLGFTQKALSKLLKFSVSTIIDMERLGGLRSKVWAMNYIKIAIALGISVSCIFDKKGEIEMVDWRGLTAEKAFENFCKNIKKVRRDKGYKQVEIEKKAGIGANKISDLERFRHYNTDIRIVFKIALALTESVERLLIYKI
jgi:transcriptional regulator with XRE-family HTH domain